MKKIIFFLFLSFFLVNLVFAQNQVDLYFFYGEGCPHCAKARPYLQSLKNQYPQLRLYEYEVWQDAVNQELFQKMAQAYGQEPQGVPTVFIGDEVIVGYDESMEGQYIQAIQQCLEKACPSPAEKLKNKENAPDNSLNNSSTKSADSKATQQFFWFIIIVIFLILAIYLFKKRPVK